MRKLDKPTDNALGVFTCCISRITDQKIKQNLELEKNNIEDAEQRYDKSAIAGKLYTFIHYQKPLDKSTAEEMRKTYTNRMAKKDVPGRSFYDKLKAMPPHGICPLCGHRQVSTLDHYLPKEIFPILSVVPYNLIPACSDCNKLKLSKVASSEEKQVLHPYYDDVTKIQWLYADVIEEIPVAIKFSVKFDNDFDHILKERIREHFRVFQLGSLYASQSGTEVVYLRLRLKPILEKGGTTDVKEFLNDEFETRRKIHVNSWQTAMYQALANNDWFCGGGFDYN